MIGQQRYLPDLQAVCMQCVDGGCGCGCGCATLTLSLTASLTPHSSLSHPLTSSFSLTRTRAILPESRQGQSDKRKKVSAGRS